MDNQGEQNSWTVIRLVYEEDGNKVQTLLRIIEEDQEVYFIHFEHTCFVTDYIRSQPSRNFVRVTSLDTQYLLNSAACCMRI